MVSEPSWLYFMVRMRVFEVVHGQGSVSGLEKGRCFLESHRVALGTGEGVTVAVLESIEVDRFLWHVGGQADGRYMARIL
jgi:hypothetical protein